MPREVRMAIVELLYFPECPNVPAAREQLRRAFTVVGAPAEWTEIDASVTQRTARQRTRADMAHRPSSSTARTSPARPLEMVRPAASTRAATCAGCLRSTPSSLHSELRHPSSGKAASFAVLPGALLSVLPVVSCPGVPFLMEASWLLPVTAGALRHRGCLPSKNLIEAARLVHEVKHSRYPGLPIVPGFMSAAARADRAASRDPG